MTIGDLLDGAFKLLKANAATVMIVTGIFIVPIQVLAAFFQRDLLGGEGFVDLVTDPSTAEDVSTTSSDGQALASLVTLLATLLVLPFVAGAISKVVAASYTGGELSAGPALRATGRRWWALTASWVLVHLLEFAGFILAVVLAVAAVVAGSDVAAVIVGVLVGLAGIPWGLAMMALLVAVAPAIVVEDLGPVRGIRRSITLLRRRLFPVLGAALLAGILANVVGSALGFVPQIAGLAIGMDRGGWVLFAVGGILTSLVTTPLIAIFSTLIYFDGRIRQEGFDLQVMADELARSGTGA